MDSALGGAIRIRRRSLGMTQETLAEACGISFQQVQKYERGTNRISFSRLVQIAGALRCRVADLLKVLDASGDDTAADLNLLERLRTPGAEELLEAYASLGPEARSSLISLVNACASDRKK